MVFFVHAGGQGRGMGAPDRVQEERLGSPAVPRFERSGRADRGAQLQHDGKEIIHGLSFSGAVLIIWASDA